MEEMTLRANENGNNTQRPLPPPPSIASSNARNPNRPLPPSQSIANFEARNPHRPLPPPPSRAALNVHANHRSPTLPPSRANSNIQNAHRFSPPPPEPAPLPPISNHPQPHQFGYQRRKLSSSSASFRGCCCCLCLLFFFIALLILAAVLVIVLAVKPKKPQFDLQRVGVQYMGITAPNLFSLSSTDTGVTSESETSASLSLNIHLLFTAVNPNKVGIKYGESKFTVMYRGIPLGKATVPGFYQDAHSEREVEAIIAVDRVNLLQADAADLIRDASLNDRVELRVLGDIGAKIRVLDIDSPGVQVSVDCSIVISPRNQSLTYKQCGFDGLNL